MKSSSTSERLKQIMNERSLRQVDILEAAKPFCEKYGVKLAKNDLSQYVSGKVEPGQEKLTILGLALNVSETWLMGYDVPVERDETIKKDPGQKTEAEIDGELLEIWNTGDEDEHRALLEVARLIKSRRNKK